MYNSTNDLTMLFKPKKLNDLKYPPLYLGNYQLDYIDNYIYLGVKIETYSCKFNMKRQLFQLYANANILIRKFVLF